jgi:hypothetical protein
MNKQFLRDPNPQAGTMKKLVLLLTLVPTLCFASQDFDKGWECGWNEGWKEIKGDYVLAPIAPFPPFPPFGKDSFKGGYNLGFLAGMEAAQR